MSSARTIGLIVLTDLNLPNSNHKCAPFIHSFATFVYDADILPMNSVGESAKSVAA